MKVFTFFGALMLAAATAQAQPQNAPPGPGMCPVNEDELTKMLKMSVKASGGPSNGGLDFHMWGAVVGRDGKVCAVTRTGAIGEQWPGSRAIAIEKANTANALSLPKFAFSTAQLYSGTQPGGFLWQLPLTNPVDTASMYAGNGADYGTAKDAMIGKAASGVVVFGGGLALYDQNKKLVGALGVSGDTSCGDHNIAWRLRHALSLDHVPAGVSARNNDAIIYDIGLLGKSSSGYGHPKCGHSEDKVAQEIGASAAGK
jgi:uncharacterized protein GlcG (DUF336 family)